MSDNNGFVPEEPVINGDTDGYAESAMAMADDNFDGDADSVEETVESYTQEIEEVLESAYVPKKSINLSKAAVAVISAATALIVCMVAVAVAYAVSYNPYNANKEGYMPTLEDLAETNQMTVDRIKEAYGLPSDMRGDTVTAAALNYMPAGLYVEMYYGIPFDTAVEAMGIKGDERINENMRYGDFEKILDEVEIAPPVGEEEPVQQAEEIAEGEETPVAE